MNRYAGRIRWVLMLNLIGCFSLAHAQGADGSASPQSGSSGSSTGPGLEEVMVTAQRRTERLQDVPIAITNLTAEQLEAQQVNQTADIPRLVPNFWTNEITSIGSGNAYSLRGLGQTENFGTYDPQVGQYVDDIYLGRVSAANFDLFDVDSVQVLRGPQGTLFGRNSTGGAIVISIARPTPEAGGYAEVGYGAFDRVFGKATVNLPLSDDFYTKTAVSFLKDHGYVDDLTTGMHLNFHNDKGIRESILWKPTSAPNVTWYATIDAAESDYTNDQNSVIGGSRVSYSGLGDLNAPVPVTGAAPIIADIDHILGTSFTNIPDESPIKTWGAMSNVEVKFDAGTLNFITGFRGEKQISDADFPGLFGASTIVPYDQNELGTFGIALNAVDRQYSQELKFTGHFGDRFNYTTGLFYLFEENRAVFLETLTLPEGTLAAPSVLGLELGAPENFHNTTKSAAGYFQGDFKATDQLTVTLGGRYTNERKHYDVFAEGPGGYDTADVNAAGNATDLLTNQFTPRAVVQYKLTPDIMAFASATRGFQGGGWNSLASSPASVAAFGPETVWSYESGIRTEFLDKRLIFNTDVFYEDVKNYQLSQLGAGGTAAPNIVTGNAANFSAYGLEADLTYRPIDELTLTATGGLEDGEYYDPSASTRQLLAACNAGIAADCNAGIVNSLGKLAPPQYFPHSSLSLNASYVWKFDAFSLTPSAGAQFTSETHVDVSGAIAGISPAHTLLDLAVKFKARDAKWYLIAECQNCMMKNYEQIDLFVPWYNSPGIWDVKVHYDF